MPKRFDIDQPEILHTLLEILDPKDRSKNRVILSDGSVLRRSEDSKNYNMFDYYEDFCVGTKFEKIQSPHILLHACFSMPWLENLRYDPSTVEYLNDRGLEIYLMEPLFLYTGESKKRFYRDLLVTPSDGEDIENIETSFRSGIGKFRSYELDSIESFVKENRLTKVTVHLETVDKENILENIYDTFSIVNTPLWPLTYRNKLSDYSLILPKSGDIENKFLCSNWRYEPHRHLMAAFMSGLDCALSWKEDADIDLLKKKLWFDLEDFPYLQRITQGCLDLKANRRGPLESENIDIAVCPTGQILPTEHYKKSFCVVITEPYFAYPFSFFSEKVINCMMMSKPFISVAPAGSIKYLRSLGFQTFDRWWPEDYDDIEDHKERLIKILDLITILDQYSVEEMRSMYSDMQGVVEHNKKHIDIVKL